MMCMAKDSFKRYIWILDTIQRYGRITLKELKAKWERSSVNDEGKPLADRTFANYKANIEQIFDIEIKCDRTTNEYFIDNEDDLNGNSIRDWMLNSLSLRNLLNESAGLHERILLEDVPSSHRFLTTVIDAMRDGKKLLVDYRGDRMTEYKKMVLHPYCLKLFKRRWFMLAYSEFKEHPQIYMLDRSRDVEILDQTFEYPVDFTPELYFDDIYGVRHHDGNQKCKVLVRVAERQVNLFRSLPIHSSQKEIVTELGYSVFEYNLKVNFDFKQEILSYLSGVEVLEPQWLRRQLASALLDLYKIYRNDYVNS